MLNSFHLFQKRYYQFLCGIPPLSFCAAVHKLHTGSELSVLVCEWGTECLLCTAVTWSQRGSPVKHSASAGSKGDITIQICKRGRPGWFIPKHVYAILPALNRGSALTRGYERDQRRRVPLVGEARQQVQKRVLRGT